MKSVENVDKFRLGSVAKDLCIRIFTEAYNPWKI